MLYYFSDIKSIVTFDDIKQGVTTKNNRIMNAKNHKIIREFTCSLSGDECLIILDFDTNEEVCMLKSDYYHKPQFIEISDTWTDNLPTWEQGYYLV